MENTNQKRNKLLKIFIIVGLLVIIILMVFLIAEFSRIATEGTACISSPFVWGARKVAEKEGGGMFCSCTTNSGKTFTFNEKKMGLVQEYGWG